ncbi:hypothetical protein C8R44DRAFT_739853 [Mycena epipterygia]|nr:hypothetical protein C8R44DRAFT_739853 [Mycena epipterygia]
MFQPPDSNNVPGSRVEYTRSRVRVGVGKDLRWLALTRLKLKRGREWEWDENYNAETKQKHCRHTQSTEHASLRKRTNKESQQAGLRRLTHAHGEGTRSSPNQTKTQARPLNEPQHEKANKNSNGNRPELCTVQTRGEFNIQQATSRKRQPSSPSVKKDYYVYNNQIAYINPRLARKIEEACGTSGWFSV